MTTTSDGAAGGPGGSFPTGPRHGRSRPDPLSYAIRHEPAHRVWLNRIGVTGSLFSVAMGLSFLLGRKRS